MLKIGSLVKQIPQEHIKKASTSLTALLVVDSEESTQSCREEISEYMGSSSLSDWFSLYIYVLFCQLAQQKFTDRDPFLNAIGSVHLVKLNHALVHQSADIHASLMRMDEQQKALSTTSSTNISKAWIESAWLTSQCARLTARLEQYKQELSARLYLVVKIVSIFEMMSEMSSAGVSVITKEMLHRPKAFIGAIASILGGLQGIDQGMISEKNIRLRMNDAIQGTLKLLGLDGNNVELVFKIQAELFEKKYLSLLEKKFLGYSGASRILSHKLGANDEGPLDGTALINSFSLMKS